MIWVTKLIFCEKDPHILAKYQMYFCKKIGITQKGGQYIAIFRVIFDLSNKIALLILLRMYALSVKKQIGEQKFKICLKSQYFGST